MTVELFYNTDFFQLAEHAYYHIQLQGVDKDGALVCACGGEIGQKRTYSSSISK